MSWVGRRTVGRSVVGPSWVGESFRWIRNVSGVSGGEGRGWFGTKRRRKVQ